jgi:hypothetical protein
LLQAWASLGVLSGWCRRERGAVLSERGGARRGVAAWRRAGVAAWLGRRRKKGGEEKKKRKKEKETRIRKKRKKRNRIRNRKMGKKIEKSFRKIRKISREN